MNQIIATQNFLKRYYFINYVRSFSRIPNNCLLSLLSPLSRKQYTNLNNKSIHWLIQRRYIQKASSLLDTAANPQERKMSQSYFTKIATQLYINSTTPHTPTLHPPHPTQTHTHAHTHTHTHIQTHTWRLTTELLNDPMNSSLRVNKI